MTRIQTRFSSFYYALFFILFMFSCKNTELKITAQFLLTNDELVCPPICMEVPSNSDIESPITFVVCYSGADCQNIESGKSTFIGQSVTVKAPDGESPGEQLATLEDGVFLKFERWSDGNTDNPRTIASTDSIFELIAFYGVSVPDVLSTTANSRGCGNLLGIFAGASSSWAPVVDSPFYHIIQGPVISSHVSDEDFYGVHETNDLNMWILLPERQQVRFLSSKNGQLGKRPGQMAVEIETGSIPTWAWPSQNIRDKDDKEVDAQNGDIAWVKGVWIFDCGHQEDDISHGAWTEIHPPVATAVMRGTREGKLFLRDGLDVHFDDLNEKTKALEGVQVDLWLNEDVGIGAAESVQCAKILSEGSGCIFDPVLDINEVHEFDIPLPPRPDSLDPDAQFRIKVLRLEEGQPLPEITQIEVNGVRKLHVRLDLTDYEDLARTCTLQNEEYGESLINCQGKAYGATIIAGWELFKLPADLKRIRLVVNNLQLFGDYETEGGNGEYRMFLHVGPGVALDNTLLQGLSATTKLHVVNPDLKSAPGEGENYPLIKDGSPMTFFFNIQDDNTESNRIRLFLEGHEKDAIWDDNLNTLERIFYRDHLFWQYSGGHPTWSDTTYGNEKMYGTVRGDAAPPILYGDGILDDPGISFNHRLDYFIEEVDPN